MMARSNIFIVVFAGLIVLGGARPGFAQFGSIFGGPPRPPGEVPSQQPSQQPTQPAVRPLPPPLPGAGTAPPLGAVQSQPLPPPPGVSEAPPQVAQPRPSQPPPLSDPASAQRPRSPAQPDNTAVQPGDEVVTELPSVKIANPYAVFSGLDKITGRITTFEAAINETVQFGALQVTPRVCYTRPPSETPNTDAFIQVDEVTLQGEVRRLFSGWMFAASPGLHAVEHPIYDIWLTDCKNNTPAVATTKPAPPPTPAPSLAAPRSPTPKR